MAIVVSILAAVAVFVLVFSVGLIVSVTDWKGNSTGLWAHEDEDVI
jgi:hypothetical protein